LYTLTNSSIWIIVAIPLLFLLPVDSRVEH
jgi:hypothetical protein